MGSTLLTHADVGDRPLATALPRRVAPTVIGDGAYLGANVTVLAGCDIGERAVVGAGSVVTRAVPAGTRVGGIPAAPLDVGGTA
jgi:acetyltransferase-like isoleucine patch superfamily enzyme